MKNKEDEKKKTGWSSPQSMNVEKSMLGLRKHT